MDTPRSTTTVDGSGAADEPAGTVGLPHQRTGGAASSSGQVVFLSAVFPLPADGGNKVMLAGLVHFYAARRGAANVHYVLVVGVGALPEGSAAPAVPPGPAAAHEELGAVVHALPRPSTRDRVLAVARHALAGRRSFQECVLWSEDTRRAVDALLDDIDPDVVVVDTVRLAAYVTGRPRRSGTTRVCYLDDLFSERYRALLDIVRRDPGLTVRPLASFTSLVPRGLRWLTDWPPTQRAILSLEARRVARSEEDAARAFDLCLLANENEADRLRRREPAGVVTAIPPVVRTVDRVADPAGTADPALPAGPVDQDAPEFVPRTFAGRAEFVLIGVMTGPHNDLGVRWLITEVLPLLVPTAPEACIDVLGKFPSPELRSLSADRPEHVRLLGFVPDLAPHLARACALLNPPGYASGIKLKVIDALSAGTPVVSTTAGAEGVDVGPEHGVLVADTAEEFATAMSALRDPDVNARVCEGARRQFRRRFARAAVHARYDEVLPLPLPRRPDRGVDPG